MNRKPMHAADRDRYGPDHFRQRGVALLTSLLVVAIGATLAVGMALRDQLQWQRAELLFTQDRLRSVLLGGEVMARRMLERVAWEDLPWEDCVSPPLALLVDDIELMAQLDNLHCRFNLNALQQEEDGILTAFIQLVMLAGATEEQAVSPREAEQLAASIRDWMDDETDDPVYRLRTPPERSANRPFLLASELQRVHRMSPGLWQALAPYVTALPETDLWIDRNHAPDLVLTATSALTDQGTPRFLRLQLSAEAMGRTFFHCVILDAPNGRTFLREFGPCAIQ